MYSQTSMNSWTIDADEHTIRHWRPSGILLATVKATLRITNQRIILKIWGRNIFQKELTLLVARALRRLKSVSISAFDGFWAIFSLDTLNLYTIKQYFEDISHNLDHSIAWKMLLENCTKFTLRAHMTCRALRFHSITLPLESGTPLWEVWENYISKPTYFCIIIFLLLKKQ